MAEKKRILFGITTKSHTELGLDEMNGLQELGYSCDYFDYGAKLEHSSTAGRLWVLFMNAFSLVKKVHQFKPDYIYFNSRIEYVGSARDFITIFLVKLFYPKKLTFLIKSHGSDLEVLKTNKYFFKKIAFPYLKQHVKGWLVLSGEEKDWIIENTDIKKESVFLVKNIVRIEKFRSDLGFRNRFNISASSTILLFAGRMIVQKGIYDVVAAFIEIRQKYDVIIIIVGDGEELNSIKEIIKKANMEKFVIFTGWIGENEVAVYTSNSDILVFPTYFPEGFPMALFNSIAAGLSILTTATRASKDYLKEPRNCIWVQPKSSKSIESGLTRLLEDPKLMNEMRENNKTDGHLFTKDFVAKELETIFHSINKN